MMAAPPSALADRIGTVVGIDPGRDALEFEGRWRTWGQLGDTIDQVAALIPEPGAPVGVLLRNRPASVGLVLGILRAGGCLVTVNPGRGVERTRADLAELDLSVIAGDPDDVDLLVGDELGATRVTAADLGEPLEVAVGRGGSAPARPGTAVRMLTSGTTGPPKRIDLTYDTLERVLVGAKHYETNRDTAARLRSSVSVVNSPLVHLGGLFRVLQCISDGRAFSFLERFTVDGWVDAVRRHQPRTASLVPAALRMVLEADLDPADLASLRSVVSGTAPLSPDDADAFEDKYGVPVLTAYAATEFGGGVAGWTLDDHRAYWSAKRGSVGRAHPGCDLRVVDPDTGQPLDADAEGLLEVRTVQLGDDAGWIRTTDQARLDADGFLWILGRADQAIIRGGFKVMPDDVRAALERHPGVRFAAVVSRPDARLGAVPVAAVELRDDAGDIDADDLLEHASGLLARYELPTEIRIVDVLARTPAGKPDLAAVSSLLAEDAS
jgi:acyl-CoA synthetase (AMP-forming)/AMP-acid ligase II